MSEHAPRHELRHNTVTHHEHIRPKASPEKLKHAQAEAKRATHEARKTIAELRRNEPQANPIEQFNTAEKAAQPQAPSTVNRELRAITLQRELAAIRRKLSPSGRKFSQFIHQPAVRIVSESASKTVSRPSGLLGGGLVALVGTTGYLILAKQIGFTYNYGVFLVLFVVGFGLGLLLELLVHLATSRRRPDF